MEITPVLPIGRQKFPRYFEGYLKFFAVFIDFYVFIPRFLAEPPTTFCGTLPWKHCLTLWLLTQNVAVHVGTLFKSICAIERKNLVCFKIMENNRTYVSGIRTVWRTVDKSAETASREIWFKCEINIFLLRMCYCWQGQEAVIVNQVQGC